MHAINTSLEPYVGLDLWDDSKIGPGELWDKEIEAALAQTKVALLLVSKNFLESRYIRTSELPYFLQKAKNMLLRSGGWC
jgi:hypothetical protein